MTTTTSAQPGLFSQLLPLLAHRAVLITVSKVDEDRLQVNICPRQLKDGENQALTIPLCVTGTAAELDAEFAAQIASFVTVQAGFNTNLAAIENEIAEAEKTAREEARKKQKSTGGGKKPPDAAPPTPVTRAADPTRSAEPVAPAQPLSLFDQPAEPAAEPIPADVPPRPSVTRGARRRVGFRDGHIAGTAFPIHPCKRRETEIAYRMDQWRRRTRVLRKSKVLPRNAGRAGSKT